MAVGIDVIRFPPIKRFLNPRRDKIVDGIVVNLFPDTFRSRRVSFNAPISLGRSLSPMRLFLRYKWVRLVKNVNWDGNARIMLLLRSKYVKFLSAISVGGTIDN